MSDLNKLKELVETLKPNYGAAGSRDVDVTAKRKAADELIGQLEDTQRRIAELEADSQEIARLAGSNAARAQKAEAELARRDAAAGEPVAWRYAYLPNVGDDSGWKYAESEDLCNNSSGYIVQPLYAAPPAPRAPDGWINCSDRMPEVKDFLWVYDGVEAVRAYYYQSGNIFIRDNGDELYRVTHWMPLPVAPQR